MQHGRQLDVGLLRLLLLMLSLGVLVQMPLGGEALGAQLAVERLAVGAISTRHLRRRRGEFVFAPSEIRIFGDDSLTS